MYVITGSNGRVGSVTIRSLIASSAPTRAVVRRPSDAAEWRAHGADTAVADLRDRAALGAALRGATGAFILLPFDLGAPDLGAYEADVISSVAGAVKDSAVPHVVMLSSAGADLPSGTGPIVGLHRMEEALRGTGTTLTALRSGHFQEKVTDVLDVARATGQFPVFAASADIEIPMVATPDLGAIAASTLLAPPNRSEVVDVIGPLTTERDVARVLGRALGRDLQVVTIPQDAWIPAFIEAGFNPHIAASLAEMYGADEQGLLAPRGDRSIAAPTRIEDTVARLLGKGPTT